MILLIVQKYYDHQLRLVVDLPLFTRFYTSQVVQEFFHQQYSNSIYEGKCMNKNMVMLRNHIIIAFLEI